MPQSTAEEDFHRIQDMLNTLDDDKLLSIHKSIINEEAQSEASNSVMIKLISD